MNRPPYNTELKKLAIPAYGRNIQNMIDYCAGIEDREERNACAYAIAAVMARKFPERVQDGNDHLIWDHMNVMADFKLDVDFPCDVLTAEQANPKPMSIPYTQTRFRNRMYGKNLETLVKKAAEMEPGEDRDSLIFMLANHMKKILLAHYPDGIDDTKVFYDLRELSEGRIAINKADMRLYDYKVEPVQQGGKKKKKK